MTTICNPALEQGIVRDYSLCALAENANFLFSRTVNLSLLGLIVKQLFIPAVFMCGAADTDNRLSCQEPGEILPQPRMQMQVTRLVEDSLHPLF